MATVRPVHYLIDHDYFNFSGTMASKEIVENVDKTVKQNVMKSTKEDCVSIPADRKKEPLKAKGATMSIATKEDLQKIVEIEIKKEPESPTKTPMKDAKTSNTTNADNGKLEEAKNKNDENANKDVPKEQSKEQQKETPKEQQKEIRRIHPSPSGRLRIAPAPQCFNNVNNLGLSTNLYGQLSVKHAQMPNGQPYALLSNKLLNVYCMRGSEQVSVGTITVPVITYDSKDVALTPTKNHALFKENQQGSKTTPAQETGKTDAGATKDSKGSNGGGTEGDSSTVSVEIKKEVNLEKEIKTLTDAQVLKIKSEPPHSRKTLPSQLFDPLPRFEIMTAQIPPKPKPRESPARLFSPTTPKPKKMHDVVTPKAEKSLATPPRQQKSLENLLSPDLLQTNFHQMITMTSLAPFPEEQNKSVRCILSNLPEADLLANYQWKKKSDSKTKKTKKSKNAEENILNSCGKEIEKAWKQFLESEDGFVDTGALAKNFSYNEAATEMVTDRSGFVWQLIDELCVL